MTLLILGTNGSGRHTLFHNLRLNNGFDYSTTYTKKDRDDGLYRLPPLGGDVVNVVRSDLEGVALPQDSTVLLLFSAGEDIDNLIPLLSTLERSSPEARVIFVRTKTEWLAPDASSDDALVVRIGELAARHQRRSFDILPRFSNTTPEGREMLYKKSIKSEGPKILDRKRGDVFSNNLRRLEQYAELNQGSYSSRLRGTTANGPIMRFKLNSYDHPRDIRRLLEIELGEEAIHSLNDATLLEILNAVDQYVQLEHDVLGTHPQSVNPAHEPQPEPAIQEAEQQQTVPQPTLILNSPIVDSTGEPRLELAPEIQGAHQQAATQLPLGLNSPIKDKSPDASEDDPVIQVVHQPNSGEASSWEEAVINLKRALTDLPREKAQAIEQALSTLESKIKQDQQQSAAAINDFTVSSHAILRDKYPTILKAILIVAAVAAVTALVMLGSFVGLGVVAGLWIGPGAFIASVTAGTTAAVGAVAASARDQIRVSSFRKARNPSPTME